jgi:hypothetical protein
MVDDINELRRLYRYLRGKNVWHATGREIASYVAARERTLIYDIERDGFSLHLETPMEDARLSLRVDCAALCTSSQPLIDVITPDGQPLHADAYRYDPDGHRHLVTIPVVAGRFRVRPRAA